MTSPSPTPAQPQSRLHWGQAKVKHQGSLLVAAYRRWNEDGGGLLAAAVAYYIGLSLFPLLLVLTAGVGYFLRVTDSGLDAQKQILRVVADNTSPAVEEHIRSMLGQLQEGSAAGGRLGLLGVLLTAMAAFVQFDRAFDRVWQTPRPTGIGLWGTIRRTLVERGIAFLILLVLGTLVLAVFISGLILTTLTTRLENTGWGAAIPGQWLQIPVTIALNSGLFTLLYRWMPDAPVRWSEAFRGAVIAAIGWEIGRHVLAGLVIGNRYSSAYGVIGSFIAVLLWCYYAVLVIFVAAEYIQAMRAAKATA